MSTAPCGSTSAKRSIMKFGICCYPQSLSSLSELMDAMQSAGANYLEFPVGAVSADEDERAFEALRHSLENQPLKIEAFNSFIPAHHRITGPNVDLNSVLRFCRVALERCKMLGGEVVVLGSAGARKALDGFDLSQAEKQFVAFGRELGPIAEEANITIAIEPLNAQEDNLILSVEHGARLVDEINHPRIQLLADLYHIVEEGEPLQNVAAAGGRLKHTHLADLGRVAPGYAENGEAPFLEFFSNLKRANYNARCSFEGNAPDLAAQAAPMLELMRRRWNEAAA